MNNLLILLIVFVLLVAIFTILLLVRSARRKNRESTASQASDLGLNEESVTETAASTGPLLVEEREVVRPALGESPVEEPPVSIEETPKETPFRQPEEIMLEPLKPEPLFTALPPRPEKEASPGPDYLTEAVRLKSEVVTAPEAKVGTQETGFVKQASPAEEEVAPGTEPEAESLPLSAIAGSEVSLEETPDGSNSASLSPEPVTTTQPEAGLLTEPSSGTREALGSSAETPTEATRSSEKEVDKKAGGRRVELYFEDGTKMTVSQDSSYYDDLVKFGNQLLEAEADALRSEEEAPPQTASPSLDEEPEVKTSGKRVELYFEDGTRVNIPPDSVYYPDFLDFANRLLGKGKKS